ncbi:hypothetical protein [Thalassorhabdomicrobium marinisediminis]|uniref:hypothetical protein n=1 Tax=Thalassorhabdomicrobium marinisediminis TaxID=2170577 RepID=UPI0011B1ECB9|nr:hypothetical protein [Thalassorhabdomicrobium marinisediminis]
MSDSSSELQFWRSVSATDVLEKVSDLHTDKYKEKNWVSKIEQSADAWYEPQPAGHIAIAEYEHAVNRARLRELGRVEPNATAAPATRLWSNHYTEDQASRLESRVREFLSYSDDWDGDGAKEIPLPAIYASLNFLDEFRRRFSGSEPRSAAPSPDGEIAMYWHGPSGYAELNFDGSGRTTMCWGDESDEIELIEEGIENVAEPSTSGIWKVLSEFLGQHHRQQQGN